MILQKNLKLNCGWIYANNVSFSYGIMQNHCHRQTQFLCNGFDKLKKLIEFTENAHFMVF